MMRAIVALAFVLPGPAMAAVCAPDQLDLRWEGGQAHLSVEIADDAAERAKGLMFREKMSASAGMLFIYDKPQQVAFWMKNTLIPLDMLFIGADGVVRSVHDMAVPGDETPIPGGSDIQYVLEISGGLAKRMGLEAGAEMRHPALAQETARWSCAQD
jgi:uncharacterized membrane protein (UPF0127 family)